MGNKQESYVCLLSAKAFMPVSVCIKNRQTHLHASLEHFFLVISFGDLFSFFFLHFIDIYGMEM